MKVKELIKELLEENMDATVHVLSQDGRKFEGIRLNTFVNATMIDGIAPESSSGSYDVFLVPENRLEIAKRS